MASTFLPLEIERRYLVALPEQPLLERLAVGRDYIRQTYLLPAEAGTTERVRLRGCGENATYTHTIKRRRSSLCREEQEETIDAAAYRALLLRADPALRVVEKTRWRIPYGGRLLELDCFPFWSDRALLEVELAAEDEQPALPDWLHVLRELSDDPRYTNRALAAAVPYEALPALPTPKDPTLRAWAEVRLDRIEHNFRELERCLPEGCRCVGVVKADAYGHGALAVARRLEALGCRYLAVACLDEGEALRQAGIQTPILVLGPTPAPWANRLAELGLTQTLSSPEQAEAYSRILERPLLVHAKLDTGMSRTGFSWEEPELLAGAMALPRLRWEGVFTHFAVSDEAAGAEFTREQHRRFVAAYTRAEALSGRAFPLHHCANSGAALAYPEFAHELVRPGLALYGVYPGEESGGLRLLPAMSLKTRVAALTTHHAGDTVSYGRRFVCRRESRLAVLSIGYGDGLHRCLSGQLSLLLRGRRAPQLGRICMDMCMADVTHLPKAAVGDAVTVFGDGLPIEEAAELAGTIPYELLCAVSRRVPRVYLG